jgi:hypothetical protein
MLSFIMPAHVAPYLRDQSVGIQNPLLHFQAQVNQAAGQAAARFTNRIGMVAIGTYGLAMGAAYGGVMAVELAGPAIAAGGAQLASAYQTAGIYIAVNFPRLTAITMAIAGGMAGVSTSSGGTAPAQAAEEQASVWTLNAFVRGRVIERMLIALRGGNQVQLASNFPVIDTALEGAGPAAAEVVSIKSLDVGAASYQAAGSILSRLTNYVDKLAGFAGRSWAGVTVNVDPNTVRTLELAIPATGATPAQLQEIATAAQYAAQQGVNFVVRAVR